MALYARVSSGIVIEGPINAVERPHAFSDDYAWVSVPDNQANEVKVNWLYDNGTFSAPENITPVISKETALRNLADVSQGKQMAGVFFTPAGATEPITIATDPINRANLIGAFVMDTAGLWVDGTLWKTATNSFAPLTGLDIQNLAHKVAIYIAACVAREAQLAAAIEQDTATDITTDWPLR